MTSFQREILDNGLVVHYAHTAQKFISIMLATRAGLSYSPLDKPGLAHLTEHRVALGSNKKWSCKYAAETVEITGGDLGASTYCKYQTIECLVPQHAVKKSLALLEQTITSDEGNLDEFYADRQRVFIEGTVQNEHPILKTDWLLYENAFEGTHYAVTLLDETAKVGTYNPRDVKHFRSLYFAPNNMALAIAGEFNINSLRSYVKKLFSHLQPQQLPVQQPCLPTNKERFCIYPRETKKLSYASAGIIIPHPTQEDRAALEILSSYLTSNFASPLFQEISMKRGYCYKVNSHIESIAPDFSLFSIFIPGFLPEYQDGIFTILRQQKEKAYTTLIPEKDFKRAQEQILSIHHIEESSDISSDILCQEFLGEAPLMRRRAIIKSLTPTAMQFTAKKYFPAPWTTVLLTP